MRLFVVLISSTLLVASPAFAEWIAVQGHSGKIQYEDSRLVPQSGKSTELGWGLDFFQTPFQVNWVHFSVPWQNSKEVNWHVTSIRLGFWTSSNVAKVTEIHVWDGNKKIWEVKGQNLYGSQDVTFSLGKLRIDKALGISVNTTTGDGQGRFQFHFASANFAK